MNSRQQLAVFLSKLKVFAQPNINLEQYPTDSEIAATILWEAAMRGEIESRDVADFGCGTGILGIGALALGARHVTFIELDVTVFPQLMENLHMLEEQTRREFSNYEIIHGNVGQYDGSADIVLQNPPFGTQDRHADLLFLEKAIVLAPLVYSLHKSSTVDFLRTWAQKRNLHVQELPFSFPLKQSMEQHKKKVQRIDVTCLRLAT